ncbi:hypothetical protein LSH36_152g04003 [Paralvinella palmiformis]|uniref:Uncharacterized protein n=1 Tax=Paralvinella palmiformis TaxID=53620 RepID=A0AAD9JUN0_9ANNE|nr:hypothetical protein LSH36_152g04003 [Paralvinella palmiformis]
MLYVMLRNVEYNDYTSYCKTVHLCVCVCVCVL